MCESDLHIVHGTTTNTHDIVRKKKCLRILSIHIYLVNDDAIWRLFACFDSTQHNSHMFNLCPLGDAYIFPELELNEEKSHLPGLD